MIHALKRPLTFALVGVLIWIASSLLRYQWDIAHARSVAENRSSTITQAVTPNSLNPQLSSGSGQSRSGLGSTLPGLNHALCSLAEIPLATAVIAFGMFRAQRNKPTNAITIGASLAVLAAIPHLGYFSDLLWNYAKMIVTENHWFDT